MKIKNIIRQFALVLIFLVSIGASAQLEKSTGTRITDNMAEKTLNETAILDLDSSTKGFYMPRMNTAQRDQLAAKLLVEKANGNENTGLAIYNTTNDCIEYWHASTAKWRSLCGSLPPAKFDFVDGCGNNNIDPSGNIKVDGAPFPSWQQGMAFDPLQHTISIRVYVSQIGTYTAMADSGNGYFFSAEGQFQSEGNYTIVLRGMGAPKNGYDQAGTGKKGDKLKFTFNNVASAKCTDGIDFNVIPAFLRFTIKKADYIALGKYYVGKEASEADGNKVELDLNIGVIGTARVTAKNEALGLGFVGEKTFEQDGAQKMTLTPMSGSLAPKLNDLDSYELTLEANVKPADMASTINGAKVKVTIEKTEIAIDHTKVDFGKEPLYQGTALNNKHIITVPVKVIGSGKANLKLRNAEGVEFEAKNVVFNKLDNPNQTQNITFRAVENQKLMPNTTTSDFTMSGDGARFLIKDSAIIKFNLEKKPVAYTIDCNNITSNRRTVIWDKPIGDTYHIIVPVDVTVAGEYELNTTIGVQDMWFSTTVDGKKAEFKSTGKQNAILYPKNKNIVPKEKGEKQTGITNADGNSETLCDATFKIKVGYPDLNVLVLIDNVYNGQHYMGDFLTSQNRFGETGELVETGVVNITRGVVTSSPYDYAKPEYVTARKKIADDIKAKKYNLIISEMALTLMMGLDTPIAAALEDYITVQKGWFIGVNSNFEANTTYFEAMKREIGTARFVSEGTWKVDHQFATANMFKKLAIVDLKLTRYYHNDLADKPRGFQKNSDRFTFKDVYTLDNSRSILWVTSIGVPDITGTNFEALVNLTTDKPNEALAMIHKEYNWILYTNFDHGNNRGMFSNMDFVDYNAKNKIKSPWFGSDGKPTFNNIKRQTAEHLSNLLKTVVNKMMNE